MTKSINTYAYLVSAANNGIIAAKEMDEGAFYSHMSSLMFSAFTMEAYLNHIGESLFTFWKEVEQLNPLSKLKLICNLCAHEIDMGKRPYQSLTRLFKFRNELAHGKTVFLAAGDKKEEPWWIDYCVKKSCETVLKDITDIVNELNEATEIKDPWVLNHESY